MTQHILLIDYENVQPRSLGALQDHDCKVMVFVGEQQSKITFELARSLQQLGDDAEYVQINGNGPNALDFHIAYVLGELSKATPKAQFHIISKDTGFDPLLRYARARGIKVTRSKAIAEISLLKVSDAKSTEEKLRAIVKNLISRGSGRPRKVKTLKNSINALFLKGLASQELEELVSELKKQGYVTIENENVSYHFKDAT